MATIYGKHGDLVRGIALANASFGGTAALLAVPTDNDTVADFPGNDGLASDDVNGRCYRTLDAAPMCPSTPRRTTIRGTEKTTTPPR